MSNSEKTKSYYPLDDKIVEMPGHNDPAQSDVQQNQIETVNINYFTFGNSSHGVVFQFKLLMLFAHRARKNRFESYHIAPEMILADKFDDLVFLYRKSANEDETWRFLQAKHRHDIEKSKIGKNDLMSSSDSDFSLQKYFVSFCKITTNQWFKFYGTDMKDFLIVTNTEFEDNCKEIFYEVKDLQDDKILWFDNDFQAKKWKLNLKNDMEKFKNSILKRVFNGKLAEIIPSIKEQLKFGEMINSKMLMGKSVEKMQLNSEDKDILLVESGNVLDFTKELFSSLCIHNNLAKAREQLENGKNDNKHKKKVLEEVQQISLILLALDDDKFEAMFDDFLEKFHFVTNYPNESDLSKLISRELSEEFDLLQPDLLSASFEKEMLDFLMNLKTGMAKDFTSTNTNELFENLKRQMNVFVANGLSEAYISKLRNYGLRFENSLESVDKFVTDDTSSILHVSSKDTRLSAIKALQTIEECETYKKIDGKIFTSLDILLQEDKRPSSDRTQITMTRNKIRNKILNAFGMKKTHNLLVIECQNTSISNDLVVLLMNLSEIVSDSVLNRVESSTLEMDSLKKIIFIAFNAFSHELVTHFKNISKDQDRISFADLDFHSKKVVLAKKVIFQGNDVELNQVIDIKENDTDFAVRFFSDIILSRFLDETNIEVGNEDAFNSIGYVEDYYIRRRFRRQFIKKEIFNSEELKSELFFITTFGNNLPDVLDYLQLKEENVQIYEKGQEYEKGIVIKAEFGHNHHELIQKSEEIFQKLGENAHWLHFGLRFIFWKASKNNSMLLFNYIENDFVNKYFSNYSRWIEYVFHEGGGGNLGIIQDFWFREYEFIDEKVVIVANDPGMGKSTVLTRMARKMKGLDRFKAVESNIRLTYIEDIRHDRWIVRINLNIFAEIEQSQCLDKINFGEDDTDAAIEFVTNMVIPGDPINDYRIRLQQNLFRLSLKEPNHIAVKKPKIVIFFDGFDEICPGHKENTTKLIKALKSSQVAQIWITTRFHEKDHLERQLQVPALLLMPFSKSDQMEFSNQFWKWHLRFQKDFDSDNIILRSDKDILGDLRKIQLNLPDEDFTKELKNSISKILDEFSQENDQHKLRSLLTSIDELDFSNFIRNLNDHLMKSINKDGKMRFADNPLQLKMLSDVIFRDKFHLPVDFGLFDLYNKFIEMKFDIYFDEKENRKRGNQRVEASCKRESKYFRDIHSELALQTIFPEKCNNKKKPKSFHEMLDIAQIGLLCSNGDQLEFVHRSYAEYFISKYFIENADTELVQELLVSKILIQDDFELIRQFFNGFLVKNPESVELKENCVHLLHANMMQNKKPLQYTIVEENLNGILVFILNLIQNRNELCEEFLTKTYEKNLITHKFTILQHAFQKSAKDQNFEAVRCILKWVKKHFRIFFICDLCISFNSYFTESIDQNLVAEIINCMKDDVDLLEKFVLKCDRYGKPIVIKAIERVSIFNKVKEFAKVLCENLNDNNDLEDLAILSVYGNKEPRENFVQRMLDVVDGGSKIYTILASIQNSSEKVEKIEHDFKQIVNFIKDIEEIFPILWQQFTNLELKAFLLRECSDILRIFANRGEIIDAFFEKFRNYPKICENVVIKSDYLDEKYILQYADRRDYKENVLKLLSLMGDCLEKTVLKKFLLELIYHCHNNRSKPIEYINEWVQKNASELKEEFDKDWWLNPNIKRERGTYEIQKKWINIGNHLEMSERLALKTNYFGKSAMEIIMFDHELKRDSSEVFLNIINKLGIHEDLAILYVYGDARNDPERHTELLLDSFRNETECHIEIRKQIDSIKMHLNSIQEIKLVLDEAIRDGLIDKVDTILCQNRIYIKEILLISSLDGQTALHVATEYNQIEIAQKILQNAEKYPRIFEEILMKIDKYNGDTTLNFAIRLGHDEMTLMILNFLQNRQELLKKLLLKTRLNKQFPTHSSGSSIFEIRRINSRCLTINATISQWIRENLGESTLIEIIREASLFDWVGCVKDDKLFLLDNNMQKLENLKNYPDILKEIGLQTDHNDGSTILSNMFKNYEEYKDDLDSFNVSDFVQAFSGIESDDLVILAVYGDARTDPKRNVTQLLNIVGKNSKTYAKLKKIQKMAAEMDQKNYDLSVAICLGSVSKVRMILNQPCDTVSSRILLLMHDETGQTVLHRAADRNKMEIVEFLLEKVSEYPHLSEQILLKVDRFQENTALHRAAQFGHHETVRTLLSGLVNLKMEDLVKMLLQMDNKDKMTAVKLAYKRKHQHTAKVIFEFIDDYLPNGIQDHIKFNHLKASLYVDHTENILKWTDQNGFLGLQQRIFKRIEPREELKFYLFKAATQMTQDDASDLLNFLNQHENNQFLKELLLEKNNDSETIIDLPTKVNNFSALDWIKNRFVDDFDFLTKFVLIFRNEHSVENINFLKWLKTNFNMEILRNALVKPVDWRECAFYAAIRKNKFDTANEILEWVMQNCDKETFVAMLLQNFESGDNILELGTFYGCPDDEITKILLKSLEYHPKVFEKLLLKPYRSYSDEDTVLKRFISEIKRYQSFEDDETPPMFDWLKSKCNQLVRSSLDADTNLSHFNGDDLSQLQTYTKDCYDHKDKQAILQKIEEALVKNK